MTYKRAGSILYQYPILAMGEQPLIVLCGAVPLSASARGRPGSRLWRLSNLLEETS